MLDQLVPVMIVAIVFSFVGFSVFLKYKTTQLKLGVDKGSAALIEENRRLQTKVTDLEERLQVIESIVTDEKVRLNNEISALV